MIHGSGNCNDFARMPESHASRMRANFESEVAHRFKETKT